MRCSPRCALQRAALMVAVHRFGSLLMEHLAICEARLTLLKPRRKRAADARMESSAHRTLLEVWPWPISSLPKVVRLAIYIHTAPFLRSDMEQEEVAAYIPPTCRTAGDTVEVIDVAGRTAALP